MKTALSIILFFLSSAAFGQLVKPSYEIDPGTNLLFINFYDASTINEYDYSKKIPISEVSTFIIVKQDTIFIHSGKNIGIEYNKAIKAKEITLIMTKKGYDTLKQCWKITSPSIVLEAYLKKQ